MGMGSIGQKSTFSEHGDVAYQIKDIYYFPIEIIKAFTNRSQFQYITKFKGPQEGTYLYTAQFFHYKDNFFIRKYLIRSWDHFIAPVSNS